MALTTEQLRAARLLASEALDEEKGITPGPWEVRSDGMTVRQVTPEDQPRGYRVCITGRSGGPFCEEAPIDEIAQDVANLMWIESARTREPQLAETVLALADACEQVLPLVEAALDRHSYYEAVRAGDHSERVFHVLRDADLRFEAAIAAYVAGAPPVRAVTRTLLEIRDYLKEGFHTAIQPPGSVPAVRVMSGERTDALLKRVKALLTGELPE